jgi:hypothetical protein
MQNKTKGFDKATQYLLPILTITGYLLISFKNPKIGLIFSLFSQVFWIYASYQSWKKANQKGIFITTIILTLTVIYGVINYWFF